jgi:hypothetical protein
MLPDRSAWRFHMRVQAVFTINDKEMTPAQRNEALTTLATTCKEIAEGDNFEKVVVQEIIPQRTKQL